MPVAYADYIRSSRWARNPARLEELRRAGYRCRICYSDQRLTVHHRTYRRLGRERASDLTTLCQDCHEVVTNILRRRRYSARPVTLLDVRRLVDGHLVDSTWGAK